MNMGERQDPRGHGDDHRWSESLDKHRGRNRGPSTLLSLCCRAVEALGCAQHAALAVGGDERWGEIRAAAASAWLTDVWPRATAAAAAAAATESSLWDTQWYRPPVDLMADACAIDTTDRWRFPARNECTMRDWSYVRADSAESGDPRDDMQIDGECADTATSWTIPQRCVISVPARLVLPPDLSSMLARVGGPRMREAARVARVRIVDRPYPLLACAHFSVLARALPWPCAPRRSVPALCRPFDQVVVMEWQRAGMRGLVCVNANPDVGDYGAVTLVYVGAEMWVIERGRTLLGLMLDYEAKRIDAAQGQPVCDGDDDDSDFFVWLVRTGCTSPS